MKNEIKNRQRAVAQRSWVLSVVFLLLSVLPFTSLPPLSGVWAVAFLSFFLFLAFVAIALMFGARSRKMERLLSGQSLIAQWEMDAQMLAQYAETMKQKSKEKNKALMWIIGFFFVVITIPFLFILDENQGGFLLIMGSILLLVFLSSLFFPWYYYQKNRKGDGLVLVGAKYAYINGYFHNWDFPLSGLQKLKKVEKPFRGIRLTYYYTDRTLRHSHELAIPTPPEFDREDLIKQLKEKNIR